ncbi:MAG TPA: adenylate/guanylate cyclase domain-containing protein [Chthonomonadales bacterium]|nr:adenylate/guanylate cyclase domain-containing protein [Chthonomonadales bacterium]
MSAPRTPTGDVTFLFTDIVGSTGMWEQHGDAFLPVLQAHNAILTDSIARCGGFLIKTEGDSYKAAFQDAAAAVRCAISMQACLRRYPWPSDIPPVRVRAALHTGRPFVQADDYFGPPVNRTARIVSAASGGQILVSEDLVTALGGRCPADAQFADLGHHRLKDLDQALRLYQVEHPDLGSQDHPPPRTLSGQPNNLPIQRTSFIGRQHAIERIASLLSASDSPIVALTGPEGIGKTRLSLQAAAEQIEWFPDGVWFVSLADARSAEDAAEQVVRTIGIDVSHGQSALQAVREWVASRRCLLILDDCGHVPEVGRLIREVLSEAPALRCLATSRQSLRVTEAREVPVPAMGLPPEHGDVREVMASESGRLFVERGSAARPDFAITEHRAPAISRLVRKTGGVPSLIERAASMMRSIEASPSQIVEALAIGVAGEVGQAAAGEGTPALDTLRKSPELAALWHGISSAAGDRRDLDVAEESARHALAIYHRLGNRTGVAASLRMIGNISAARGDYRRAALLLRAAYQIHAEIADPDASAVLSEIEACLRAAGQAADGGVTVDQAVRLALHEGA